jgi:hypothetical protein
VDTLREDFNNTAFVDGREQIPHDYTDHLLVLGDRKGCITPEQLFSWPYSTPLSTMCKQLSLRSNEFAGSR